MSNSTRWILFLTGIVAVILSVHYFLVPLWPSYPMMGWGSHRFGPRIFPWGSFIGLLTIFGVGFVLYKLLSPASSSQSATEEDSCPYCGRKFERSESLSQEPPETIK
jgi:hypothetical protein